MPCAAYSNATTGIPDVDPDTTQAVEDVLGTVVELRSATAIAAAAAIARPYSLNNHTAADQRVQDLADLIASRARSVHVSTDAFLELANARIAADRRRPPAGADRANARTLLELTRAQRTRQTETAEARCALRTARAQVADCEHRERMADEALRAATVGSGIGELA